MSNVSGKSFAEREFPNEASFRQSSIDLSYDHGLIVALLASRVIADGNSASRDTLYNALFLIQRVLSTQVTLGVDEELVGIMAEPATPLCPAGVAALRELDLESATISREWRGSPIFPTSCFSRGVLLEFLHPEGWRYLDAFIALGPSRELIHRVHSALSSHGEKVGEYRLRCLVQALWIVMRELVQLRSDLLGENEARAAAGKSLIMLPASLQQWTRVLPVLTNDQIELMAAGGEQQERAAVPLESLRTAAKDLACAAGWGLYEAQQWPFNYAWRELKRLVVFCLLVTACPRISHLRLLNVDDFDPAHVFEDGSVGPAIRFLRKNMKKGQQSKLFYWKRLPDVVGSMLLAWIACSGRRIGQPDAPLIIATRTRRPGEPGRPYSCRISMSNFVVHGALVPKSDGGEGYCPHRFRNSMTQGVERLLPEWKLRNPGHHLVGYSAETVAELALDHAIRDLGYRDYRDRRRLEELLALAISVYWAEIWGEGIRRRGPDLEPLREALTLLRAIYSEQDSVEERIRELERDEAETLRAVRAADDDAGQLRALNALQHLGSELRHKLHRQIELASDEAAAIETVRGILAAPVDLSDSLDEAVYTYIVVDAQKAVTNYLKFRSFDAANAA
jgi:hypothetical protein